MALALDKIESEISLKDTFRQKLIDIANEVDRTRPKVEEFEKTTKGAGDAAEKAAGQHSQMGGALESIKGLLEVTGIIAGVELLAKGFEHVAEILPEAIEKTTKLGAELFTTSLKTGISVEGLSGLRFVAAQTGT